ncbi:MAG: peptidylprolyl isomerase [Chromatiales bacterium 21-64-14]|nr:MAG: peptidylprolyl isomerase [Chromatiales bacterium 21-64-14]HQU15274.1 peptidylprolyl isomerase [Gammaproteobacteria bacterium]
MQIAKHKVVTIEYTLTDAAGEVVDTSDGREPFSYIQGTSSVIPGLEAALEGHSTGDTLSVSILPEDGYGLRQEALTATVPRERFESDGNLEVGMQFQTEGESGLQVVTIVDLDEDSVTVDANHPLAGATLNFDVAVVDVRDASPEELSHGHVHGPEGHAH